MASTAEVDDDFTPVTHKKTRAPKKRKGQQKPRERTLSERIEARRKALGESGYPERCRALLRSALSGEGAAESCPPPACAVCLGLGSVAESSKSQDQLVLLQELLKELEAQLDCPTEVYDPVTSAEDMLYLSEAGFEVLNTEHSLEVTKTTFLYMPHCPRTLFDELLRRNWSPAKLSRLVIFGNRLDMYDDPTHSSASSSLKTPFIARSLKLWTTIAIPADPRHLEGFNDLALQWIPPSRLAEHFQGDIESEELVDQLAQVII